jgi:hypothetical protein
LHAQGKFVGNHSFFLREQEIAGITGLDAHEITASTEIFDVFD